MTKGDIVASIEHGTTALVLALTHDGKRAKLHVFGRRQPIVWKEVDACTVATTGEERCWKCSGSGLYYFGGAVVNGVYQGRTGPCYACEGKGKQTNADRLRCHYYWYRFGRDLMPSIDGPSPARSQV
jgi:hypothetical protein